MIRALGAVATLAAAVFAGVVSAQAQSQSQSQSQDFPNKPVSLIHGFGAGGNADTMARILGEAMSKGLGQRVVVMEPRPGRIAHDMDRRQRRGQ